MTAIDAEKRLLRKKYKDIRGSIADSSRRSMDAAICESVTSLPQFESADVVLSYVSVGSEVDTLSIIEKALAAGKTVACPRCESKSHTMTFYRIRSLDDLCEGAYGLLEPRGDESDLVSCEGRDAICIVPALAFDRMGRRLGYGGGYYDRFLAEFDGASVGLCYGECVADNLPADSYDRCVDIVIGSSGRIK